MMTRTDHLLDARIAYAATHWVTLTPTQRSQLGHQYTSLEPQTLYATTEAIFYHVGSPFLHLVALTDDWFYLFHQTSTAPCYQCDGWDGLIQCLTFLIPHPAQTYVPG